MKILKFLSLLIFSGALFGSCSSKDKVEDEQIRIIPLPNYYQSQPGVFEMDKNTVIGVDLSDTNMVSLANYLNEKFMRTTGFGLSIKSASEGIVFTLVEENDLGEELSLIHISEPTRHKYMRIHITVFLMGYSLFFNCFHWTLPGI